MLVGFITSTRSIFKPTQVIFKPMQVPGVFQSFPVQVLKICLSSKSRSTGELQVKYTQSTHQNLSIRFTTSNQNSNNCSTPTALQDRKHIILVGTLFLQGKQTIYYMIKKAYRSCLRRAIARGIPPCMSTS